MKLKSKLILVGCFSILAPLSSCEPSALEGESPLVNKVKQGEHFIIKLPEEHQSGYTWSLVNDFDTKTVDYIKSTWHGNEKGIYFKFLGAGIGQTELHFVKRKYRDTADYKHFTVVIVKN